MAGKVIKIDEKVCVMICGLVVALCVRSGVGSREISSSSSPPPTGDDGKIYDYGPFFQGNTGNVWAKEPITISFKEPHLSPESTWAPDARECKKKITPQCLDELIHDFLSTSHPCCLKIYNAGLDCYHALLQALQAQVQNEVVWGYCEAPSPSPHSDDYYS